ncbi:hypothetical protein Agub_g13016, partial [Astrephomene gubernaculifera]
MGHLRHLLEYNDVNGIRALVQALWASRQKHGSFTSADADDAVWFLQRTADNPGMQAEFWPRFLGLLTRWAFTMTRGSISGPPGTPGGAAALAPLQQWLAGFLESHEVPWIVHAPALLLLAVLSMRLEALEGPMQQQQQQQQGPSPQVAVHRALSAALAPQRPPAPDLLQHSGAAVTDLCAAAELVLERLAVGGDPLQFAELLGALMATLSAAV